MLSKLLIPIDDHYNTCIVIVIVFTQRGLVRRQRIVSPVDARGDQNGGRPVEHQFRRSGPDARDRQRPRRGKRHQQVFSVPGERRQGVDERKVRRRQGPDNAQQNVRYDLQGVGRADLRARLRAVQYVQGLRRNGPVDQQLRV